MARILHVRTNAQLEQTRALLTEYFHSPHCSICFRDFEAEVGTLPGEYAPPMGRLLLATYRRQPAGLVGVSKVDGEDGVCKMKRLYVRPQFRGRGIGRSLAIAAIATGRRLGYAHMRLWTFPFMKEAIRLYQTLGFDLVEVRKGRKGGGLLCMQLALRK